MKSTPKNECPCRAVPEPGEQKYNPSIEYDARQNATRAAERNVDIVPEPSRKRDMPVAPEVAKGLREIRTIEIDHQLDAEKLADANRAVRITREVAVDLERIKDHADKAGDRRVELRILKGEIHVKRQQVGDNHLFEKTVDDELDALQPLLVLKLPRSGELGQHLGSTPDRPCDDLREEGEIGECWEWVVGCRE